MPSILDLFKPLGDMTTEEMIEKVRAIRDDRKISKHAEKRQVEARVKRTSSFKKLFDSMTEEQKAALIASLEGA